MSAPPAGGAVTEFLDWLDAHVPGEAAFKMFGEHRPGITCVYYRDTPLPGSVFASTFGLSLRQYAVGWGREVTIRVDVPEPVWAWAVAHVVAELRHQGAQFAVGDTYNLGDRISDSSGMTAFVIGEPSGLSIDETVVHLSTGEHIVLVQAFPMHEVEMVGLRGLPDEERVTAVCRFIQSLGSSAFDVTRAPSPV